MQSIKIADRLRKIAYEQINLVNMQMKIAYELGEVAYELGEVAYELMDVLDKQTKVAY